MIREVLDYRRNQSRQNRKENLVQYHRVEDVDLLQSRLEEEEDYWLSLKSEKMARRVLEKPCLFLCSNFVFAMLRLKALEHIPVFPVSSKGVPGLTGVPVCI